jgi:hypothetical protein
MDEAQQPCKLVSGTPQSFGGHRFTRPQPSAAIGVMIEMIVTKLASGSQ